MPWQPMHIEFFPLAASAFPAICAWAWAHARLERSRNAVDILITRLERRFAPRILSFRRRGANAPRREAAIQSQRHRRRHSLPRFLRLQLQLLLAIDDH